MSTAPDLRHKVSRTEWRRCHSDYKTTHPEHGPMMMFEGQGLVPVEIVEPGYGDNDHIHDRDFVAWLASHHCDEFSPLFEEFEEHRERNRRARPVDPREFTICSSWQVDEEWSVEVEAGSKEEELLVYENDVDGVLALLRDRGTRVKAEFNSGEPTGCITVHPQDGRPIVEHEK